MNKPSQEELQLIQIVRDLRPFETVEIKLNEKSEVVFIYTKKEKTILLTNRLA